MISGGNFSLNDMVVDMSNNVMDTITVPAAKIEISEEYDASIHLEPEYVGWKARWIEVVNEFKWIHIYI